MAVLGRKKICPDCAERVASAAKVCRYCGYRFPTEAVPEEVAVTTSPSVAEVEQPAPKTDPEPAQPEEPTRPVSAAGTSEADDAASGAEAAEAAKLGPPHELGTWGLMAKIALVGIAAATVYALYAAVNQASLIHDFIYNAPANRPSLSELEASDRHVNDASTYFLIAYLVGGLLFIGFFRDAYVNMARFGARGFRYSFNEAAWAWIVPFFNLVRPKQVANDIWRGSHSFDPSEPRGWRGASVSPLVHWWWFLYLVSSFGTYAANRAYSNSDSLSSIRDALQVESIFRVLQLIALGLAFLFVSRIVRAQVPRIGQASGGKG